MGGDRRGRQLQPLQVSTLGSSETFGIDFALGQVISPATFNRVIARVGEAEYRPQVMEQVLRSQTQAYYAPQNTGHFGLSLGSYAHFTSPIRRYSDLIVHRGLIRALGLGKDGLTDREIAELPAIAEGVTMTERRSMAAERDAMDRYIAAFLEDRVGATFTGRITGVTRFGLFIRLDETGADGLVPVSTLGGEYFAHDDRAHALVGERTGKRFTLGRMVEVRLVEARSVASATAEARIMDRSPKTKPAP